VEEEEEEEPLGWPEAATQLPQIPASITMTRVNQEATGKAAARKLRQVAQCLEEAAGLVEAGGDLGGGLRTIRGAREDLAKIEQMNQV